MKSYKEFKPLKEIFQKEIFRLKIYEICEVLKEFISTAILNPGSLVACGMIK